MPFRGLPLRSSVIFHLFCLSINHLRTNLLLIPSFIQSVCLSVRYKITQNVAYKIPPNEGKGLVLGRKWRIWCQGDLLWNVLK